MTNQIDERRVMEQFDEMTISDIRSISSWDTLKTRMFDCIYFDGAGMFSSNMSCLLFAKLNRALSIRSGLSQGGAQGGEEEELENIVRDLAAAIVGREISFGEELQYPGKKAKPGPYETLEYLRQRKQDGLW